MPETVHGENHIICSYCEQDFKDYADDDYCFIIKKKHIVLYSVFNWRFISQFNDYYQKVEREMLVMICINTQYIQY